MIVDPTECVDLIADASVGVKWLVPESHSDEAAILMRAGIRRHVPSLFFTEVSQTIWKKSRIRSEFSAEKAREITEHLLVLPLVMHPVGLLFRTSFEIALETGRSVYDSVYLALARAKGWKLVTADERLYNGLKGHPLHSSLIWVSDIASLFPEERAEIDRGWVGDFIIPEFSALHSAEQIELEMGWYTKERLTDEHLAHSPSSEVDFLDLSNSLVTDAGLIHLRHMPNLKNLNLKHTCITDAGLVHLAGCVGLERLNLEGTYVSDDGLMHLQTLTNLRAIDIDDTDITEVGRKAIRNVLPDLRFGLGENDSPDSPPA